MSNLIKNNTLVDDDWTLVTLPAPAKETVRKQAGKIVVFKSTGETAATPEQISQTMLPDKGKIIVPLSIWQARKNELDTRSARGEVGIWLETFELLEDLKNSVSDINNIPLIAIYFPRAVDGRGFSQATLLRSRYGYRNELRAIGDILRDQLFYMQRCGFNAFAIRTDRSAEDALASLRDFSDSYQGAVDNPLPVWRRYQRMAKHKSKVTRHFTRSEDQVD